MPGQQPVAWPEWSSNLGGASVNAEVELETKGGEASWGALDEQLAGMKL